MDIPLSVDKSVDNRHYGPISVDNAVSPPVDKFQECAIYQGKRKGPLFIAISAHFSTFPLVRGHKCYPQASVETRYGRGTAQI